MSRQARPESWLLSSGSPLKVRGRAARIKPISARKPGRSRVEFRGIGVFSECTLYQETEACGDKLLEKRNQSTSTLSSRNATPWLVYYESQQDVGVAIGREKQIKRRRREKKIALIEKINPRWQDLAENGGREMRFRGQSLGRTP
jgi:putative endonuclease